MFFYERPLSMNPKILLRKTDACCSENIGGFVLERVSLFNGQDQLFCSGDKILLISNSFTKQVSKRNKLRLN